MATKRTAWNKGMKGLQPWMNTSGLGKNIDFQKRGQSISKARKGTLLLEEHKKSLSDSQTEKWADTDYREAQKQAMADGNTGGWNKNPIEATCIECSARFYTVKSKLERGKSKYCSKECSDRTGLKTPENNKERAKFRKTIGQEVLRRDNYTCQMCGSKKNLQVDHIQRWSDYVELRFNMENCRTLCGSCHYQITFGKPMPDEMKAWGYTATRRDLK